MMFKFLKDIYANNKVIFANFTYLWILQFIRIIIPVVLIPVLIKNIGLEKYGIIIFSQTLVAYLMIIMNFGFEMSATKQISLNRNNNNKLSEIVSSVLTIQIIFFLIIGVFYFVVLYYVAYQKTYFLLFLFSFFFCLQEIFLPIWYFQGLEKMKFITIIDAISRLASFALIIFFVGSPDDYLLVPIFRLVGLIIAGMISMYLIFIKDEIKVIYIKSKKLFSYLRDGFTFFVSRFFNVVNERTNSLLLGTCIGMDSVAYYDFLNKVISAINLIFGTLVKVLYPSIAISKDKAKVKKILYFNLVVSLLAYVVLCVFSKSIVLIMLGNNLLELYPLFYCFGLSIPLVAIGWTLGDLLLAAFNYSKKYSVSSIIATISYLVIICNLFFFNIITLYSLIIALIARLIILDMYRFYLCRKYRLI